MEEKTRKISLTLRVDEDTHRQLKLHALRNDTTIQDYIMGLVEADFENNKEEEIIFGRQS